MVVVWLPLFTCWKAVASFLAAAISSATGDHSLPEKKMEGRGKGAPVASIKKMDNKKAKPGVFQNLFIFTVSRRRLQNLYVSKQRI